VIRPEHACRQNYIFVYGFTLYTRGYFQLVLFELIALLEEMKIKMKKMPLGMQVQTILGLG
jgi:hypothetical protein